MGSVRHDLEGLIAGSIYRCLADNPFANYLSLLDRVRQVQLRKWYRLIKWFYSERLIQIIVLIVIGMKGPSYFDVSFDFP